MATFFEEDRGDPQPLKSHPQKKKFDVLLAKENEVVKENEFVKEIEVVKESGQY